MSSFQEIDSNIRRLFNSMMTHITTHSSEKDVTTVLKLIKEELSTRIDNLEKSNTQKFDSVRELISQRKLINRKIISDYYSYGEAEVCTFQFPNFELETSGSCIVFTSESPKPVSVSRPKSGKLFEISKKKCEELKRITLLQSEEEILEFLHFCDTR